MPVIFFVGHGVTPKAIHYEYKKDKYVKNNFIELLEKMDQVIIPDIPYHHVYYYQKQDIIGWKERYNSIDKLIMNDIYITDFIKHLKFDIKQKYILIGHSDGIYFAMEFARQYPDMVKHIISLDGSWITTKLCKQRLINWEKKGKQVKLIEDQYVLNEIVNKIKLEKDNNKYINQIVDHTRLEHTNECIKNKYEDIIKEINYTVFRDFNSKINDDADKQFNEYAVDEHNILSNLSDKYRIYWLVNASHNIWFNELYKKEILEQIERIINFIRDQSGGNMYYHKYTKYKSKYLGLQHGGKKLVIHIAGPQGSGKTTMGNELVKEFKNKIHVKDLDDLWNEYYQYYEKSKIDYQEYIDDYIKKHNDKPLIFVGLDANLCLGPRGIGPQGNDIYYDFHTDHKYYINNPIETTLRQRFYRQVDKMHDRKEQLFNNYLKNPKETQDKLIRFVNIDEWKENTKECDELYKKREYKLTTFNEIYDEVKALIMH